MATNLGVVKDDTNFAVGSIVVLCDLVSAAHLNDKEGIIKSGPIKTPGPHLNRFMVNLFETNKVVAVKPDNMICRQSRKSGEEFLDPSTDYTVLEDLGEMGQPFLFTPGPCACCASNDNDGSVIVECEHLGKPSSAFRQMGGQLSFLGFLQMPNGTFMKMDDPRDYLEESESYPGHTMTAIEVLSEWSHCDDYEGSFHQDYSTRNIGPSLIDFRDMTTGDSASDDITMYPFHANLEPPYTLSMAPKFRADDVITIITNKEFKLSEKLSIEPGVLINVYVISFASSGVVTGIIETNKNYYWVYFPHYCVRQLVKRGSYWKPE